MFKDSLRRPGGMYEMMLLALPMVVSHACDTVMIFTDRVFLSRLGPQQMNAAMGGGLTSFMLMSFFLGLIGYTTALVAQYFGSGQKDKSAVVMTQAVILAVIAYPVILCCRPLGGWLFQRFEIEPAQLVLQNMYFDILILASFLGLVRCAASAFFSGIGRTRIVMISSLAAMAVNIPLNYILIYGKFGFAPLGVRGAAYGTILGSLCGTIVLVWAYLSRRNWSEFAIGRSGYIDGIVMRTLVRFGYPAGLEMFLNILAFNLMVMIFYSCGPIVATAATIVFNWDMVSFVPLLGIEIGVTSLVGRYMGAQQPHIAQRAVRSGIWLGVLYASVLLVLFVGFPQALVNLFRPQEATATFDQAFPIAVFMVRIASVYVLIEAMIVAWTGALRGAGDSFWAMALSVALHWTLVPVLYVLLKVYGASAQTGWVVLIATFFVFSFLIYLRYRSGRWKRIRMVCPAPEIAALPRDDFHEPAQL